MTNANLPKKLTKALLSAAVSAGLLLTLSTAADAGAREQAKRMYDRLAGVPPTNDELASMVTAMSTDATGRTAANIAMQNPNFLNVTVKNMFLPMTNKDQTVFYPFNDAAATLVGLVRDGDANPPMDFRQALYGDVIYTGTGGNPALPAYSQINNDHYAEMEKQNIPFSTGLVKQPSQTPFTGVPSAATSGVLTTRQSARAFFYAGTNRAMLRFTLLNYLCSDLEDVKDTTRIPDRIHKDVSRSPGGDSTVFLNTCVGCHAGMDGLAGAYAYYNWNYNVDSDPEGNDGSLTYAQGQVQTKYLQNNTVFPYGYVTTDDSWINYWRNGLNANLGWANNGTQAATVGNGMKSMNQELANTEAFARCQAVKVYKTVCFNEPTETVLGQLVSGFKTGGYNMKLLFADSAFSCRGN